MKSVQVEYICDIQKILKNISYYYYYCHLYFQSCFSVSSPHPFKNCFLSRIRATVDILMSSMGSSQGLEFTLDTDPAKPQA